MSIDLTSALHDAVDGGTPVGPAPVDVARVRSRARRRRAVHLGARSAAGVGAAGAVAFGVVQVVGPRDARTVLPADADAVPGACGSTVTSLLGASDPTLGLGVSTWSDPDALDTKHVRAPGPLGTFAGDTVYLDVVSSLPADGAGTPATEESSLRDTLALLEQGYAERLAAQAAGEDVDQAEIDELAQIVESMRASAEAARDDGVPSPPPTPVARVRVLVTYDDRVVAATTIPRDGQSDADAAWDRTVAGPTVRERAHLPLETCTVDGVGGDPLPSGTYEVLVARDAGAGVPPTAVAGPWTLVVPPRVGAVTGLPDDFPTDVVPMPPGRLLEVSGAAAEGWTVQIAVEGDDRFTVGADLLDDVPDAVEEYRAPTGARVLVPGWAVELRSGTDGDVTTLRYSVAPL
jgi:hypothetical protein